MTPTPRTDRPAMWRDPDPQTFTGRETWELFEDGQFDIEQSKPDAGAVRALGQRITQIETEARQQAIDAAIEAVEGLRFDTFAPSEQTHFAEPVRAAVLETLRGLQAESATPGGTDG